MSAQRIAGKAADGLYESLVHRHRLRVLRLCRLLLPDADEAEDAVQETFEKLLRQCRDGAVLDDPARWLSTVAIHACRDRRRSRWARWWRGSGTAIDTDELAAAGATPEESAIGRAEERRIFAAFAVLSARQREVFWLRHVEGLSTGECAVALDLDAGSVKRHLFRAVRALRRVLEGDPR